MTQNKKNNTDFESATAATMRAMARCNALHVNYSANETIERPTKPHAQKATIPLDKENLMRGIADSKALFLSHHNEKTHHQKSPSSPKAKGVFDLMEQARCESIGINQMPGAGKNITKMLNTRYKKLGFEAVSGHQDTHMRHAVYLYCLQQLCGAKIPPTAQKMMDQWRPWIDQHMTPDMVQGLKSSLHDQRGFASHAHSFMAGMGLIDHAEPSNLDYPQEHNSAPADEPAAQSDEPDNSKEDEANPKDSTDQAPADLDDNSDGDNEDSTDDEKGQTGAEQEEESLADETPSSGGKPDETRSASLLKADPNGQYLIYTKQFDEIIKAEELADPYELEQLRELLDSQLQEHQNIIARLANRLQRKLMAQQQRSWQFDLDEGILDAAKLTRIITGNDTPRAFKIEKQHDFKDTIVTLLIDNSGSMRGKPIALAAICTDIVTRTLERCGIKVEVLGFTTRAWKGGKARALWMENDSPPSPGRLNDLRHIIYKSADIPLRRLRNNLGLMLKEGVLKENIDGEALVWAHNRLSRRSEHRKILMVISDGAPVDDSTLATNHANMLEADLHQVIGWIEQINQVELTAIGIGHDVTRYYSKALTIKDAHALGDALIKQLDGLFEK